MVRGHHGFSWEIGCPFGLKRHSDKHEVSAVFKTITGLSNARMGYRALRRNLKRSAQTPQAFLTGHVIAVLPACSSAATSAFNDYEPEVAKPGGNWAAKTTTGFRRIIDARFAFTLRHHGVTHFATANEKHFEGFGFQRVCLHARITRRSKTPSSQPMPVIWDCTPPRLRRRC
jgi:hypothetical protein